MYLNKCMGIIIYVIYYYINYVLPEGLPIWQCLI